MIKSDNMSLIRKHLNIKQGLKSLLLSSKFYIKKMSKDSLVFFFVPFVFFLAAEACSGGGDKGRILSVLAK